MYYILILGIPKVTLFVLYFLFCNEIQSIDKALNSVNVDRSLPDLTQSNLNKNLRILRIKYFWGERNGVLGGFNEYWETQRGKTHIKDGLLLFHSQQNRRPTNSRIK